MLPKKRSGGAEPFRFTGFTAEGKQVHYTRSFQNAHTGRGEIRCAGTGIDGGQLQHQIHTAPDRFLCPDPLIFRCRISPLGEITAHHRNHSACTRLFPDPLNQIPVSVVEGIKLCYDSCCFHSLSSSPSWDLLSYIHSSPFWVLDAICFSSSRFFSSTLSMPLNVFSRLLYISTKYVLFS